jgi:hypothetical protein
VLALLVMELLMVVAAMVIMPMLVLIALRGKGQYVFSR